MQFDYVCIRIVYMPDATVFILNRTGHHFHHHPGFFFDDSFMNCPMRVYYGLRVVLAWAILEYKYWNGYSSCFPTRVHIVSSSSRSSPTSHPPKLSCASPLSLLLPSPLLLVPRLLLSTVKLRFPLALAVSLTTTLLTSSSAGMMSQTPLHVRRHPRARRAGRPRQLPQLLRPTGALVPVLAAMPPRSASSMNVRSMFRSR